MQLDPGEKSILAYFHNYDEAVQAAQILSEKGFTDFQIDRISGYATRSAHNRGQSSLSSLVMGRSVSPGSQLGRTQDPLLASDPSVSGMSDREESITSYPYLLTVVAPKENIDQALDVVKRYNVIV